MSAAKPPFFENRPVLRALVQALSLVWLPVELLWVLSILTFADEVVHYLDLLILGGAFWLAYAICWLTPGRRFKSLRLVIPGIWLLTTLVQLGLGLLNVWAGVSFYMPSTEPASVHAQESLARLYLMVFCGLQALRLIWSFSRLQAGWSSNSKATKSDA
jgi:hypothetical protein